MNWIELRSMELWNLREAISYEKLSVGVVGSIVGEGVDGYCREMKFRVREANEEKERDRERGNTKVTVELAESEWTRRREGSHVPVKSWV